MNDIKYLTYNYKNLKFSIGSLPPSDYPERDTTLLTVKGQETPKLKSGAVVNHQSMGLKTGT